MHRQLIRRTAMITLDVQTLLVWSQELSNLLPTIDADEPEPAELRSINGLCISFGLKVNVATALKGNRTQALDRPYRLINRITRPTSEARKDDSRVVVPRLVKSCGYAQAMNVRSGCPQTICQNLERALYVHEIGARTGVPRTYYSSAIFPVIQLASWCQARIKQLI